MPSESEVRSGARLIGIVEMLALERRQLTAGEIGAKLDIPPTTVHRIMATLARLRWVEKRSSGGYVLGAGFLGVGGLAIGRSSLVHLAKPVLRQVAEMSGLQSYLGVIVGGRVTFLSRAVAAGGEVREFQLGAAQPLHATSAGKVLIAFMPGEERDELLGPGELLAYTSRTIVDRTELDGELERIRSAGYSVDAGEYSDVWRSMSFPVLGPGGQAVAAVTCGGPADQARPDQQDMLRHEIQALTEELSEHLA